MVAKRDNSPTHGVSNIEQKILFYHHIVYHMQENFVTG